MAPATGLLSSPQHSYPSPGEALVEPEGSAHSHFGRGGERHRFTGLHLLLGFVKRRSTSAAN